MRTIKLNMIDLPKTDYQGGPSTLCPGCGHDQITSCIIEACWQNGIEPHRIAKMSGIGCSSKTPAYFLSASHGFNTVHGRMPSVTTGASVVNPGLIALGVSGDGDTASIGIGQFLHAIRRNLDMVYIVENNGVYGLTKGQHSATTEKGSKKKKGPSNETPPIDLCALALQLNGTFIARAFSGSKKSLTSLIQAALSHRGFALIDVISPCVTFNNNEGSTRSYQYVKQHEAELHTIGYIPPSPAPEQVEVPPGEFRDVELHDGSVLRLEALADEHDASDPTTALAILHNATAEGRHVTGLLHHRSNEETLIETLGLTDTPLVDLSDEMLRPPKTKLDKILAGLRERPSAE